MLVDDHVAYNAILEDIKTDFSEMKVKVFKRKYVRKKIKAVEEPALSKKSKSDKKPKKGKR